MEGADTHDVLICGLILVILFIKINSWFNFTIEYTWDILYLLLCTNLLYHDSIQLASKVHPESISLTFLFYNNNNNNYYYYYYYYY